MFILLITALSTSAQANVPFKVTTEISDRQATHTVMLTKTAEEIADLFEKNSESFFKQVPGVKSVSLRDDSDSKMKVASETDLVVSSRASSKYLVEFSKTGLLGEALFTSISSKNICKTQKDCKNSYSFEMVGPTFLEKPNDSPLNLGLVKKAFTISMSVAAIDDKDFKTQMVLNCSLNTSKLVDFMIQLRKANKIKTESDTKTVMRGCSEALSTLVALITK